MIYIILDNEGIIIKIFIWVVNVIDIIVFIFDLIEIFNIEVYEFSDVDWEIYVKEFSDNSNLEIIFIIEEDVDFNILGVYVVLIKVIDMSDNEFVRIFNVNVVDIIVFLVVFNIDFIYVFNVSDVKMIINEVVDNYYDKN